MIVSKLQRSQPNRDASGGSDLGGAVRFGSVVEGGETEGLEAVGELGRIESLGVEVAAAPFTHPLDALLVLGVRRVGEDRQDSHGLWPKSIEAQLGQGDDPDRRAVIVQWHHQH